MRTLRQFRSDDAGQVRSLHERALIAARVSLQSGAWDDDLKNIETVYLRPGGCFYVVEEEGRLLAMGGFRPTAGGDAEIKRMRVEPEYQRQGLGQLVMDALFAEAKRQGIQRLVLDTTEQQVAAQKLYEKNGFTRFQTRQWREFTIFFYERNMDGVKTGMCQVL